MKFARFDIRCEWGPEGLKALAPESDVLVIIDVLSFTTCVEIAVSRGCVVHPFRWNDQSAVDLARSLGAVLAAGSRKDPAAFSLAPSSMLRLPEGSAVVLPSLNGARLSLDAPPGLPVLAACLRNARAAAGAAARLGKRITLLPAGERWPDGSLRPALEDWLAAGAVIAHLPGSRSPEAASAEAAFLQVEGRLTETLLAIPSGIEIIERGTPRDVELAAQLNVSAAVPNLLQGAYRSI